MAERILLSPPDVGEAERTALLRAFDSGWIAPVGPELDAFERELADYVGAEACVALSSATAGLHLGLIALGVEPGQEVVVPTSTFAASAFAVRHAGAVPIFCDVDPETWCLDVGLVDRLFAERDRAGRSLPAAVMPVDLYGLSPAYGDLMRLCRDRGVAVIEDAAEGLGSAIDGCMTGTFGDLGVFSFNGNKIITTSGGGAVVGPPDLVARVRHLSTQAREPVLHYEHVEIGYNHRMSNILAAMGRAQLAGLPAKIDRRREINARYRDALPEMTWLEPEASMSPNCWLTVGLLPAGQVPSDVCGRLDAMGIEARPTWKPMHQQLVFSDNECVEGGVADDIFQRGLCLPSGSSMTDVDVDRVVDSLRTAWMTVGS